MWHQVAEGVATAPAAVALARKYGVDAPIMAGVAAVISGEKQARYDSGLFCYELGANICMDFGVVT